VTTVGLATRGLLSGGGVGLVSHGIASSLGEGAPVPNDCGIPYWAERHELPPLTGDDRNPRYPTPNEDPQLHLNPSPQTSLAESLGATIDLARQIAVDIGLRPYLVFSVVIRWSGGEPHRGNPTVIWERPFLPVPKVENIEQLNKELRPFGTVSRGEIRLTKLSPRYTADDIALMFPCELRKSDEHFVEVRIDERDGRTNRQRYTVSGVPERKTFEWTVRLEKQDEARLRNGRVRNA
jgi:hypothetical protein